MVNVLVVDDEVPIRQWMEFCINKMEGYQVVGTASNGAEGCSVFRRTRPDIVITDIRMPVMDGLEMLKMIRSRNPAVYAAVLTSHEDFEYARQAIKLGAAEYILKTEITAESLRQVLENGKKAAAPDVIGDREKHFEELSDRNHYLRSLVLGQQEVRVSKAMAEEYDIPLEARRFMAMDIMTQENGPLKIELLEDGFLDSVIKVPLELNHTALLGNLRRGASVSESRQREELSRYCRFILDQVPCSIGCSDIYDSLERLGDAMRQAYNRVKLGFYHPRESVFGAPFQGGGSHLPNGEKYKIRFSKELVNQNYRRAVEIRDEMMAGARRSEVTDIEYLKKLYLFFLTSLYHMTKDNVNQVEAELAGFGREMAAAASLDELDAVIRRGFELCGGWGMGEKAYSAPIRSAVLYMEAHFAKSLTLPDVAAHAGLSAEYLSRLFKEETGVKFVVYLNNLKLKHALHLLETTNLKVYEVAEQVGYSNLSYFSTVFKKNFGQNPFDYKNHFGNSKNSYWRTDKKIR